MTLQGEPSQASPASGETGSLDLQALSRDALQAQFHQLLTSLDAARAANDAQRSLMLALQTHEIELEIQGRMLSEARNALEVSRDHYARLFDDAPVGYVVFSRRGVIRATNRTAARLLGRSPAELEGQSFKSFMAGDAVRDFVRHLRRVFQDRELLPPLSDLSVHLVEPTRVVRLRSVRRDGLKGAECLTVLLDITAEHEAERQRLASDRLRQSVLDVLPSQIAVLDREGRILTVNRAWTELAEQMGGPLDIEETPGLAALAACRWSGKEPSAEALAAARGIHEVIQRKTSHFSVEYPCDTPEGQRWFLMRVLPLDGEREGAVVAYLDITERHLAEEEARRTRDTLAQVARLNAVGILASSLIHELLQPLSSAGFYCSAAIQLAQGPAANPGRLLDVIRRIDDQVHRAGDIMERLRAFLRGRQMYKVSVPLEQLLRRVFELVLWFATDRKVQLALKAPEGLPVIETDPVQIEQVLVNLICNAVQAIDSGGCERREVALGVEIGPRDLELIVSDTGPGLPPGRHEAVFDIFESTNDSSLGLGLAISRAIAEAHGGRLWAESAPSEGAVFHLRLPICAAEEVLDEDPRSGL